MIDDDWCFEEKGGVGELWAGVAAAKLYTAALLDLFFTALLHIFCSALLDKFCSAPHACATTIHSFGPGDTGTNMEANSGEICTCEENRGQFWGRKGQNG